MYFMLAEKLKEAANLIKEANYIISFTGAGISVESGIPPFRGEDGLWSKYDPQLLDINYFFENPVAAWELSKNIFYDVLKEAQPNRAHKMLAEMEGNNLLKTIITQNIDNLHQEAGSQNVLEFHGNARKVVCTKCGKKYAYDEDIFRDLPPYCDHCQGLLKPDFIFFGEEIPEPARTRSFIEAEKSDLIIIVGTTGEIQPASMIPVVANDNGAAVIEINTNKSNYTESITDIFLQGKATEIMGKLKEYM